MHAFDGENEVSRRKAQAKAAGDAYMKLAGVNRPRRRFFLGAWLSVLGQRLQANRYDGPTLTMGRRQTDQTSS